MEQLIQKPSLPIKTKIAAWWMMVNSIIGIIIVFLCGSLGSLTGACEVGVCLFGEKGGCISSDILFLYSFIFLTFLMISSIFLLKKKKMGWWMVMISVLTISISGLLTGLFASYLLEQPFSSETLKILDDFYYIFYFLASPLWVLFAAAELFWMNFCVSLFLSPFLLLPDRRNFWKVAK